MFPAQPPLPTAWNFPFQLADSGIQTSMSTTESADGFSVAATRQCAGSTGPAAGAAAAPPRPPPPRPAAPAPSPRPAGAAPSPRLPPRPAAGATGPPGGPPGAGATYGPAATRSAEVIVVFGSESVRSDSHGAACASAAMSPSAVTVIMGRYCTAAGWFKQPARVGASRRRGRC